MKPRLGYAFALSRLVARLTGHEARRAGWSGLETYGVCLVVFGISLLSAGQVVPLFVRQNFLRILAFVLLPVVLWIIFLLLYYLVSLLIRLLRRLGLYRARTNGPIQNLFFIALTTGLSLLLVRNGTGGLKWCGELWLGLLLLNLISIPVEKLLDRA